MIEQRGLGYSCDWPFTGWRCPRLEFITRHFCTSAAGGTRRGARCSSTNIPTSLVGQARGASSFNSSTQTLPCFAVALMHKRYRKTLGGDRTTMPDDCGITKVHVWLDWRLRWGWRLSAVAIRSREPFARCLFSERRPPRPCRHRALAPLPYAAVRRRTYPGFPLCGQVHEW